MLVRIEINATEEIIEYSIIYSTDSQLITDGNEPGITVWNQNIYLLYDFKIIKHNLNNLEYFFVITYK